MVFVLVDLRLTYGVWYVLCWCVCTSETTRGNLGCRIMLTIRVHVGGWSFFVECLAVGLVVVLAWYNEGGKKNIWVGVCTPLPTPDGSFLYHPPPPPTPPQNLIVCTMLKRLTINLPRNILDTLRRDAQKSNRSLSNVIATILIAHYTDDKDS